MSSVSIVIRARNAVKDLRRCLGKLREQIVPRSSQGFDIIVVDNESSDGTRELALEFGAKVVSISRGEFTWGRALNIGVAQSRADIVLILSADAYPADVGWVAGMTSPFEDPRVAAVYGRQLPRPDAPVDESVRLKRTFPAQSMQFDAVPSGFTQDGGSIPVSNACAAIRRAVWESLPYDECIAGGEEGVWTFHVLERGYRVVYSAEAQVFHSHNDSIMRHAWRLWELIQKSCELNGKAPTAGVLIHSVLAAGKSRLFNCFGRDVTLRQRVVGLLRFPPEAVALLVAAWLSDRKGARSRLRQHFWK